MVGMIPAWASSIAAANPVGPAPTIRILGADTALHPFDCILLLTLCFVFSVTGLFLLTFKLVEIGLLLGGHHLLRRSLVSTTTRLIAIAAAHGVHAFVNARVDAFAHDDAKDHVDY